MSLCIECGCAFCCDGTLYSTAPLKKEDIPHLLAGSFDVRHPDGSREQTQHEAFFMQPCRLCRDDRCSIHEQKRPAICGDYQCKLLARHESGKVSTKEAGELVRSVKQLRDRLRPQLEEFTGADRGLPFPELALLVTDKLEGMEAAERQSVSPNMLLEIGMFRVLLAKNFDSRLTKQTRLADKALLAMEDASVQLVQSESARPD